MEPNNDSAVQVIIAAEMEAAIMPALTPEYRLRFLGQPRFLLGITGLFLCVLGLCALATWLSQPDQLSVLGVTVRAENPLELVLVGGERVAPSWPAWFRVLVRNGRLQEPIAGAEVLVTLVDQSGRPKLVAKAATDGQGSAIVPLELPKDLAEGRYSVVARTDSPLGGAEVVRKVFVQRGVRIAIEPERARYMRGETLRVRLTAVSSDDGHQLANEQILLTITDSHRNKVFKQRLMTSSSGVVAAEFPIAEQGMTGAYRINAALGAMSFHEDILVGIRFDSAPSSDSARQAESSHVESPALGSLPESRPSVSDALGVVLQTAQRFYKASDTVQGVAFTHDRAQAVYIDLVAAGRVVKMQTSPVTAGRAGLGLALPPSLTGNAILHAYVFSADGTIRSDQESIVVSNTEDLAARTDVDRASRAASDSYISRSKRYQSHDGNGQREHSPRRRAIAITISAPFVVFVVLFLLAATHAAIGLRPRDPVVAEGSERTELDRTTRHLLLGWFVGLYVPVLLAVTAELLRSWHWEYRSGAAALFGVALATGLIVWLTRRAIRSAGMASVPLFRSVVATVPMAYLFGALSVLVAGSRYHMEILFARPFVMRLDDVVPTVLLLGVVYGGLLSVARLSLLRRLRLSGWFWALLSRPLVAALPVLAIAALVSVQNYLASHSVPEIIDYDGTPRPVDPENVQGNRLFSFIDLAMINQPGDAEPRQSGPAKLELPPSVVGQDGVAYPQTRSGCLSGEVTETITIPDSAVDGSNDLYLQLHSASFLQPPDIPPPKSLGSEMRKFVADYLEPGSLALSTTALYATYLRKLGDLAPATLDNPEEEIREALKEGCAGLLSREDAQGGLVWIGSSTPNALLTAYALAALVDSAKVIPVDPQVIGRIRSWLVKQQRQGRYSGDVGQKITPSSQPLSGADLNATAFIAWILGKAGETTALSPVLDVLAGTPSSQDIHTTALRALALGTAGRTEQAAPLIELMAATAVREGDYVYFTLHGEASEHPHEETTALGVQALLLSRRHTETAHRALRWLLSRQRVFDIMAVHQHPGEWASNRATMQVVRALDAAALSAPHSKDARLDLRVNGTPLPVLRIEKEQRDVSQHISLRKLVRKGVNTVTLSPTDGAATCYTLVAVHHLPWSQVVGREQRPISVSARYQSMNGEADGDFRIDMQVGWTLPGILPLAVLEFKVADGVFVASAALDDFEKRGLILGYQLLPGQMRLYLRNLEQDRLIRLFCGVLARRADGSKPGRAPRPTSLGTPRAYAYFHPTQSSRALALSLSSDPPK